MNIIPHGLDKGVGFSARERRHTAKGGGNAPAPTPLAGEGTGAHGWGRLWIAEGRAGEAEGVFFEISRKNDLAPKRRRSGAGKRAGRRLRQADRNDHAPRDPDRLPKSEAGQRAQGGFGGESARVFAPPSAKEGKALPPENFTRECALITETLHAPEKPSAEAVLSYDFDFSGFGGRSGL